MIVTLASDHAGFTIKQDIVEFIKTLGYEVLDLGTTDETTAVDYPDFAEKIDLAFAGKQSDARHFDLQQRRRRVGCRQ